MNTTLTLVLVVVVIVGLMIKYFLVGVYVINHNRGWVSRFSFYLSAVLFYSGVVAQSGPLRLMVPVSSPVFFLSPYLSIFLSLCLELKSKTLPSSELVEGGGASISSGGWLGGRLNVLCVCECCVSIPCILYGACCANTSLSHFKVINIIT